MHKPTEFYTVLRLFPAATYGTRTQAAGWGQLTDALCTESEAWEAYVEGFHDEDAPTRHNSVVVRIDLAEGTSRDLSEDWAAAYAEEFPAPEAEKDQDYADFLVDMRRYDMREVAA